MYLVHTAHLQFLGLTTGFLGWILTMVTVGLNEWRLWHVDDVSVITSGVAWVGIWKVCFYTHVLPQMEFCRSISMSDSFLPVEIPVAQVLMVLAVILGLAGSISGGVAMRMVYFTVEDRKNIRLVFILTGTLYLFSGSCSLVPLVWNMNSVHINSTIDFPPEYHLPVVPVRQQIGIAIGVGIFSSILMFISGLLFLSYKYARHTLRSQPPRSTSNPLRGPWTVTTTAQRSNGVNQGSDNPAFFSEEVS
ncbi:claudin-34 [Limanda limanda]|uniref:claudin-34 n=1 Tax=Limanda limanda TaxID=27771 RepID=UPI0029C60C9E|nr:claudin-34 [Limanda limanda]